MVTLATSQKSPTKGSQQSSPTHSPSRSRSKSRARQNMQNRNRRRSRSAARGGGSYGYGRKDNRPKTVCWYGRTCRREDCWFSHPDGRIFDEKRRRDHRSPSQSSAASSSSVSTKQGPEDARSDNAKATTSTPNSPSNTCSFRDFVLEKLDDFATAEEAVAQYESFEKQKLQQTVEDWGTSGLLFDFYNPIALVKHSDLVMTSARLRAAKFIEDVEKQRFTGLDLKMQPNLSVSTEGKCELAGHVDAPYFAFDPHVHAVALSELTPTKSVWDMYDILLKQPGFVSASTARLADDRTSRTYYARFETSVQAEAALKFLSSSEMKEQDEKTEYEFRCVKAVDLASSLESFVLPPSMSFPERIGKDFDLTMQLTRKLDSLFGIPAEVTDALLNAPGSIELKLDLQVMYLRRVHCFCFYSGQWCKDEWDLLDRCGAALLRSDPSRKLSDAAEAAGSKWAEAHEARMQDFLATASFEMASLPSVDEERLQAEVDVHVLEAAQGKYQCTLCGKCFRDRCYVHKHVRKVHTEIEEKARQKAYNEMSVSAFLADPKRPGWSPSMRKAGSGAGGGA